MDGNGHDSTADFAESDELLSWSVREAISRSEPIRASAIEYIDVRASGGKVVLAGLVGSEAQKYVAAQLAASVPGVKAVENRLVTREGVERRVSVALAASPETRHLRIHVRVSEATVSLYGVVETQREADLALTTADKAAGGLVVQSEIRTLPAGQEAIILEQHSLEGRQLAERPREADEPKVDTPSVAATKSASVPPVPPVEGMA